MRPMRIELTPKGSYIRYQRGMVDCVEPVIPGHLRTAWRRLKVAVRQARIEMRGEDKLAERGSGHFTRLLAQKRAKFVDECLASKKPLNACKHVGVEIEFLSHSSRRDIARSMATAGLHSYVELKHDGSVKGDSSDDVDCDGSCREGCRCSYCEEQHYCDDETECHLVALYHGGDGWVIHQNCPDCGLNKDGTSACTGHCQGHNCPGEHEYDCDCECTCSHASGHEIAVVAKSKDIAGIITRVCAVLSDHNAKVNVTCGLHVHVDARGFHAPRMFSNLVKAQRLLYSMVPASRKDNQYCAPNGSRSMSGYSGRYWGINPQSFKEHGTVEVRLHSGTVNADKIINWIKLLQKIAYAKRMPELNSLSDLTDTLTIPRALCDYIVERVQKFAKGHGRYSIQLPTETPSAQQPYVESDDNAEIAA